MRGRLRWRTTSTGEQLFARARAGDPRARGEIDGFCAEIAPKIATLALTVDPALIVIGGGLSRAGDHLIRPLSEAVHHMLMTDVKPPIVASLLKSNGTVCGALGAAFETFSADIFGVPGVPIPWQRWPGTFDLSAPRPAAPALPALRPPTEPMTPDVRPTQPLSPTETRMAR